MPITKILAGRAFSPDDMQVITEAYNSVVAKLKLETTSSKENAAKIVVNLAGTSARLDIEELAQSALRQLQADAG